MGFDNITLNTDRNRDNLGLQRKNGTITGLFPVYDHDSCFKGKSEDALYFVTHSKFSQLLPMLNQKYHDALTKTVPDIKNFYDTIKLTGKEKFAEYGLSEEYDDVMSRTEKTLSVSTQKNRRIPDIDALKETDNHLHLV